MTLLIDVIGYAAALASTVSFVPQSLKVIRSHDTRAISASMYALTVTSFSLWAIYGFATQQWSLVASNLLCLAMAGFILVRKLVSRAETGES